PDGGAHGVAGVEGRRGGGGGLMPPGGGAAGARGGGGGGAGCGGAPARTAPATTPTAPPMSAPFSTGVSGREQPVTMTATPRKTRMRFILYPCVPWRGQVVPRRAPSSWPDPEESCSK